MSSSEAVNSRQGMVSRIRKSPSAIGSIGIGFLSSLKALPVNDTIPTVKTIQDGVRQIARAPLCRPTAAAPRPPMSSASHPCTSLRTASKSPNGSVLCR